MARLYQEFMDGKTTDYIKRIFEREGVKKLEWRYEVAVHNLNEYVGE